MKMPEIYGQLIWICIVVSVAAILSDSLQPEFDAKLIKCIIDNIGHAVVSAAIWNASFLTPLGPFCTLNKCPRLNDKSLRVKLLEIFVALCIGSLVDADHFIAAGWSTSLAKATSLPSRPFAHSVTFIFLVVVRQIFYDDIVISSLF